MKFWTILRNELLNESYIMDEPKKIQFIKINERSQLQNPTYYMIPFICDVQSSQIKEHKVE